MDPRSAAVTTPRIPVNDLRRHNAVIGALLDDALVGVRASGRYVLGEQVEAFENDFASYCGVRHAIGTGNGLNSLEIALRAVGVGPNDRVATVANAGGYASIAVLNIGAYPRYVDIDRVTLTMDVAACRTALAEGLKAVVVTHLFGRLADVESIVDLATAAGVPVIEDCAQAHGARRGGRMAGSFGTIGCFSFYPTKNLGALGDGGAITTMDDRLAQAVRSLRQYGWTGRHQIDRSGGCNSRLDEIQAAVLRVKLRFLDRWNDRRREIAGRYRRSVTGEVISLAGAASEDDVAHLCVARCPDRDGLRQWLAAAGIETQIHYPTPDHQQPGLAGSDEIWQLLETEAAARQIVTLPNFPEMTEEEIQSVCERLRRWCDDNRE
jgi:dTDP-4-amino-4,6-dideoxygalactose transaminase